MPAKPNSARFLWHMRPYFRQVAGELVLGSLCGILINTAVVLPALLLGRAVDEVLRSSRGESTPAGHPRRGPGRGGHTGH